MDPYYNRYYVRWPGFRRKALTLSYDDGVRQDARMIEILDRYGLRATFNLNGGDFALDPPPLRDHPRLTRAEALALDGGSPHEVAAHSFGHPFLEQLPAGTAAWEAVRCREALEAVFGALVRGFAYPMGTWNDDVADTLRLCGLAYARTTPVTHSFDLPKDFYRLQGTCRGTDPALFDLGEDFLALDPPWGPKLFYIWGHSYEFDEPGGWDRLERFCRRMGGHTDIWYATNLEICDYLTACGQLRASMDGRVIQNSTAATLYLDTRSGPTTLAPGQTLTLA